MTTSDAIKIEDGEQWRRTLARPSPQRSRVTLRTLNEVAEELARVYRRADRGQIATADATKLAYILVSLAKVIEAGTIEQRLSALEGMVHEQAGKA